MPLRLTNVCDPNSTLIVQVDAELGIIVNDEYVEQAGIEGSATEAGNDNAN
jgi:hypothetical protein